MTDVLLILKIMQMISLEIEVGLYQYLSLKLIILKTWRMNLILMLLRIRVLNVNLIYSKCEPTIVAIVLMKINNERFSIAFCSAMDGLGITTVGQAKKFLSKAKPAVRIHHTRVAYLQKELKQFFESKSSDC